MWYLVYKSESKHFLSMIKHGFRAFDRLRMQNIQYCADLSWIAKKKYKLTFFSCNHRNVFAKIIIKNYPINLQDNQLF